MFALFRGHPNTHTPYIDCVRRFELPIYFIFSSPGLQKALLLEGANRTLVFQPDTPLCCIYTVYTVHTYTSNRNELFASALLIRHVVLLHALPLSLLVRALWFTRATSSWISRLNERDFSQSLMVKLETGNFIIIFFFFVLLHVKIKMTPPTRCYSYLTRWCPFVPDQLLNDPINYCGCRERET